MQRRIGIGAQLADLPELKTLSAVPPIFAAFVVQFHLEHLANISELKYSVHFGKHISCHCLYHHGDGVGLLLAQGLNSIKKSLA